jgi:arabinan endo-1,5-alpha-L-arabinosidase
VARLPVIAALALALAASGCAAPGATPPALVPPHANPVLDRDFPDPAVLQAADGSYYAYATQGDDGSGAMRNIQLARSGDLVSWEPLGDALPVKPAWASKTQDFWAPHVHEAGGTYFMYYSTKPDRALEDETQGLCLAVATAARPEGPFTDIGQPLLCGEGFVNIDPMAFDDPATGKRLLYWGSGFGPIKVQELAEDRVSFAPGSTPVPLVAVDATDDPANYQRLVEGAWVIRRDGWYYLFYSGDNCCGPNAHYALMVARSRSATGPFETLAEATGRPSSVILAADQSWNAPGHNAVITSAEGTDWVLYHAVDRRRDRAKPDAEPNTRRVMLLRRIVWDDGWPTIPAEAAPGAR